MNPQNLDPKQFKVLPFIQAKVFVSALDIANILGLTPRTVRDICKKWVKVGFLQIADPSRKARMYKLGAGNPQPSGAIETVERIEQHRPLL